MAENEITPEFQRGWDAALVAARQWHEDQAKKALVQSRRSRFPKNLEREAALHIKGAELIEILSPTTSKPATSRHLTAGRERDLHDRLAEAELIAALGRWLG